MPQGGVTLKSVSLRPCSQATAWLASAAPKNEGDGMHHSNRLPGVLAAIAPADEQAPVVLSTGDNAPRDRPLAPTVSLIRDDFSLADRHMQGEIVLLGWLICISGMNTVRKHLSRVKGGQLAAAHQARMLCLMISDAPGDDPALIGSGPTLGEYATPEKAQAILARWHVPVPGAVRAALSRPSGCCGSTMPGCHG